MAEPHPDPATTDAVAPSGLGASAPAAQRPLVLVSWSGRGEPLPCLLADATPQFDLLVFDYSGQHGAAGQGRLPELQLAHGPAVLLSERTQCKGDIYQALARWLLAGQRCPPFVGLIDDDVVISVQDINRLLHLGRCHDLHAFSAALSHDSEYTHRWSLRQPNRMLRPVHWVEVMMPIYAGRLFLAGAPHYAGNTSSWGIDKYLMPTLQQLLDLPRCCVVDAVMASHIRPITSGQSRFDNGLTAAEEARQMKQLCQRLVAEQKPALLGSAWYRRTFEQRHDRTRWQQLWLGLGRPLRRWLEQST